MESKKIMIEFPAGFKAELKQEEDKYVLVAVSVEDKDNSPVTERIKTFEDAVIATGITIPLSEEQLSYLPKDVIAYMKLRVIAAALNGLTKDTLNKFPKFNSGEYRYYPLFDLYTQTEIDEMDEERKKSIWMFECPEYNGSLCGLTATAVQEVCWFPGKSLSSRISVKTRELAMYFGEQFIDVWAEYVFKPNIKE